jgi:hypothetical protein
MWIKGTTTGSMTLSITWRNSHASGANSVNIDLSKTIAYTSSWTRATVTFTITQNIDPNNLVLDFEWQQPSGSKITGVQLEEGSVATPFERRPYATELALCQRYYFTTLNQSYRAAWHGLGTGNYVMHGVSKFPVTMRTAPSVAVYAYHLEASGLDIGDGRNGVAVYNGGLAAYFTHTFGYGVRSSADAIFGINAGENTSNNVHYAAGYVANAEL